MRLVFSRCALTQRHLTWELKQNTCEPCNASTTMDHMQALIVLMDRSAPKDYHNITTVKP